MLAFIQLVCVGVTSYFLFKAYKSLRSLRKTNEIIELNQRYKGTTGRGVHPAELKEEKYVPPTPPWHEKYFGPRPFGRCYRRTDDLGRPVTNAAIYTEAEKAKRSGDHGLIEILDRITLRKWVLEELKAKSPLSDKEIIRAFWDRHPRAEIRDDPDMFEEKIFFEISSMHEGFVLEAEEGKVRGVIESYAGTLTHVSNGRNVIVKGREEFEYVEEHRWLAPLQFLLGSDDLYGEYLEKETGRYVIGFKPNFYDPDFRRVFFCGETGIPKAYSEEDGTLHKYTGSPEDVEFIKISTNMLDSLIDSENKKELSLRD